MDNDRQFDANQLDELVVGHRNAWYSRGCAIGQFVIDIPDGDYKQRLIEHLGNLEIGHAVLLSAIRSTGGPDFRSDALRRHRLRQCSCTERAWS